MTQTREERYARQAVVREERRAYVRGIKVARGCVDCGATGPVEQLDYDHRPGEVKVENVSRLANRAASFARLDAEIAKCDVRCRSCHSLRHVAAQPDRMHLVSAAARGKPRPTRHRVSAEQARIARDARALGATWAELAAELGTTAHTVRDAVARLETHP